MFSPPILIYDGDCSFCTRTVLQLRAKVPSTATILPYQRCSLSSFNLTEEECSREIKFVSSDYAVFSGANAFAEFFKQTGWPWKWLGFFLSLPLVKNLAGYFYRWIAKNRYKLPGGSSSCNLD